MNDKSHLLRFGYAPGNYWFVCSDCGDKQAVGDKRATRCYACAETLYSQVSSVEAVADKHRAMTTVPEEAVKAMPERIYAVKQTEGSNCVVSFDTPSLDYNVEYVRADLAFPHLPQGVGVKKMDEWTQASNGKTRYLVSVTVAGDYTIALWGDRDFRLSSSHQSGWVKYDTIEAAKAAAQADFEARILSALEPSAARSLALEEGFRKGLEAACEVIDAHSEYDRRMCCDGHECGCYGATVHQSMQHYIRALSSTDHAAAGKVEGDGWLRIGVSTPRDQAILAWGNNWHWGGAEKAYLHSDYNGHKNVICRGGLAGAPFTLGQPDAPTHWCPLPSAPASEGAE